jgi:iron(III) transport system permease protein
MARPAIAAGIGLVCMETLADFGVVAALNVDTFTTAIYRAWFGMFSIAAALQMAAILGLLALTGVWLERRLRGNRSFATNRGVDRMLPRQRLERGAGYWRPRRHAATVLALRFRAADDPVAAMGCRSCGHGPGRALLGLRRAQCGHRRFRRIGSRGSRIGARLCITSRAATAGCRGSAASPPLATQFRAPYSPSDLFAPVAAMNGWLQGHIDTAWGANSPQLFLQGTLLTMFVAYLARFLAVGTGPVESGLARIHRNLDEAAESLAVRGVERLRRVHLPLLRGSLLAGAVLVFVDLMKELPITLMTRPFGFETLAVRVFEMAAEGEWTRAALPSVLIVLAGMVPVVLLARRVTHVD